MAVVLNFLNVDALVPLEGHADLKEGFTRVPLTLSPPFTPSVLSYTALAPLSASALSIGATSFSKAGVRLNDAPGSLRQVALPAAEAVSSLSATLHSQPDGAELARYTVTVTRSDKASAAGETVKIDTSVPAPAPAAAAAHAHSHGGVPCTADHGHGHGAAAAEAPKHGHSHDGVACTADHGAEKHGHAHAEPPKHGHSHDGGATACTKDHGEPAHGHAHAEQAKAHGHAHAEPEKAHGHSHAEHGHAHAEHGHAHASAAAPVEPEAHGHSHGGKPCGHAHGPAGYGGADGEWCTQPSYRFQQDGDSVTVEIGVPAGTKGGDLKVLITGSGVECGLASGPGGNLLCGLLAGPVCKQDSSWSLVSESDGRRLLVLNLAKAEEGTRWISLLK